MKNKSLVILILAALFIAGGVLYYVSSNSSEVVGSRNADKLENSLLSGDCPDFSERTLKVNNNELSVGIADTPDERALGLGGCKTLADNEGLYFSFKEDKETAFWMKKMLIPIDIIWILDGKVVGIEHNVQPPTSSSEADLPIYESPQKVDSVLEIIANGASKRGIKAGSKISF